MHKLLPASLVLAMALPGAARADADADIRALRAEIETMRSAYEARLQALERRLEAVRSGPVAGPAVSAAPAPAVTAALPAPPALSTPANRAPLANAFNPAISLILSGLYARTSRDPARYAIRGFALPEGAEAGPGGRGFSLAESELVLSANVDPCWRAEITVALHGDDAVSVEEAYVQTTALGNGLLLRAGRYLSDIGYLNPKHAHTWDFVDNPLAYQALLGTQYGDDGLQLKWLAPTDRYLEFGAELGRGRSFPGSDTGNGAGNGASRNGAGMWSLFARTGGDIGASHNWRAGVSVLNAKASSLALADTDAAGAAVVNAFSGRTRVVVADAVWKWAPGGNATRTNVTVQGEVLRSRRTGSLVYDVGGADSTGDYRGTQSGWYVQGVYQFIPRWRVGLRTERLDPGTPDYGANAAAFAPTAWRARKHSLMFDFNASEFSRVRLQLAQDRAREGASDNQLFLQYQMSLGAHGAHRY